MNAPHIPIIAPTNQMIKGKDNITAESTIGITIIITMVLIIIFFNIYYPFKVIIRKVLL